MKTMTDCVRKPSCKQGVSRPGGEFVRGDSVRGRVGTQARHKWQTNYSKIKLLFYVKKYSFGDIFTNSSGDVFINNFFHFFPQ